MENEEDEKVVKGKDELPSEDLSTILNEEDIDPEVLLEKLSEEKGKELPSKETLAKSEPAKETPSPSPKEEELLSQIERLRGDKTNLQKALHEERQGKKAAKEAVETPLTDADLVKIMEEHKDDPAVILNTLNYKMNILLKKGTAQAVNEVEIKGKADELGQELRRRYGTDIDDESSPIRQQIERAKEYFDLKDHHYGEGLSAAMVVFTALPQIKEHFYQQGVKDQMEGKVEKERIEHLKKSGGIVPKKPAGPSAPSAQELTSDQLDTAKRLGFDKNPQRMKIYKTQILKVSNT